MSIEWFDLVIFPGIAFVLFLTLLLEQINSRVYARFTFKDDNEAMFIPIVGHLKLITSKKKERFSFKSFFQAILLLILLAIPLVCCLFLPIAKNHVYFVENYFGAEKDGYILGSIGILSFEGDILVVISLLILFSALLLVIQLLSENKPVKESLSSTINFLILDIPLIFTFAAAIILKKSLSVSLIAQDIRFIIKNNPLFGFLIFIPVTLFISILVLNLKFDQPYFDHQKSVVTASQKPPVAENWKLSIWHTSLRLMELFLAGMIVSLFLGGSNLPIPRINSEYYYLIANTFNFVFKLVAILIIIAILKSIKPRMRLNQLISFNFKILTPISLGGILLVGGYIAIFGLNT